MKKRHIDHQIQIRQAVPPDVPLILAMIQELADYEQLGDQVTITESQLQKWLFGELQLAKALIAEFRSETAGYALFFHNFSTFLGQPGLYLEDLYVRPSFRRKGIGGELLLEVASIAHRTGCGRLEWAVLDWNRPAIDFYRGLGAVPLEEWTVFRLTGTALKKLAGSSKRRDEA